MRIQDFVFNPMCPDGVVQQAEDTIAEDYSTFHERCNAIVFYDEGPKKHYGQSCHSFITLAGSNVHCIVNENASLRRWGSSGNYPAGVNEFLNWFTQESFFSRFILNKDNPESLKRCFVISSDIPCNLLQNMNIICRHFWECGEASFKVFKELIDLGYSPELGYSIGFNTNISRCVNTYNNTNIELYPPFDFEKEQIYEAGSGHRAWEMWTSLTALQNFLKGEFGEIFRVETDPSKHFRHYKTINGGALYCGNHYTGRNFIKDYLKQNERCRDVLAESRKNSNTEVKVSNPFLKPNRDAPVSDRVNYKELIEIVLPMMKEEGLFNVA